MVVAVMILALVIKAQYHKSQASMWERRYYEEHKRAQNLEASLDIVIQKVQHILSSASAEEVRRRGKWLA